MILDILSYTGSALMVGPVSYITYRVFQFRNAAVVHGRDRHDFKAHIRRDMYGPHTVNWCDVCKQGRKAWIHHQSHEEKSLSTEARILELEREEIKWRFENDPGWVKIFGHEYDPKTFDEIPKFHNGECGGPNDSCERCAWEADQREAEKKERRRKQEQALYAEKHTTNEKSADLLKQEMRGYLEILRDIWDDLDGFQDAHEEWEDIRNEIGMLKNDRLRRDIKDKEPFKRLAYFFDENRKLNWNRREEIWQDKLKRDRRNYDQYDPYDPY